MTSARSHFYRLAPLAILLLLALVVYLQQGQDRTGAPAHTLHCADLVAGCLTRFDGREVGLGVVGQLKVLHPFELWVRAPWARRVQASFTMEGMDMGFNLYTLRADNSGVHRARITLPVCVSGRRDWVMTLEIDGLKVRVPFVTQP
ncbi:MAG: hypothetical protein NZ524_05365 [Thiobacillaceae bacterium]|nr:hypothetical protein [Thiobacillaceae bacterium]MCX7674185.1 hypothetical protein [Thiobacillaceae bacterium]MDW8322877.1 hypothetical protein [Burkholderiales bacterium]